MPNSIRARNPMLNHFIFVIMGNASIKNSGDLRAYASLSFDRPSFASAVGTILISD
jgi:hypothetical protein